MIHTAPLVSRRKRWPALPAAAWTTWFALSPALAAEDFVLVATEQNTKDMSVNLSTDMLRSGQRTQFGRKAFSAPIAVAGRDTLMGLLNHDSGVLDVQHTDYSPANLSSRILLQFETLAEQLQAHCWTAADASNLRATLQLYVIPPAGPQKHNRLLGVSPSVWFPPAVGLDPPPARVPIGVYRQPTAWNEGAGQNSFYEFFEPMLERSGSLAEPRDFSSQPLTNAERAHYRDLFLDSKTVGVMAAGTTWGQGEEQRVWPTGVDVCLNREPGVEVRGTAGNRATLCYDETPDWQPWMSWDVSEAVRQWMAVQFDPEQYHGFTLYPMPAGPGENPDRLPAFNRADQVRITPEVDGQARSRAVVSFASSSGAADCRGAGGLYGGPGQVDVTYANLLCMTSGPALEDNPLGELAPGLVPEYVAPLVQSQWTPRLVIEGLQPSGQCPAHLVPDAPSVDSERGTFAAVRVALHNRSPGSLEVGSAQLTALDTNLSTRATSVEAFSLQDDECADSTLEPGQQCQVTLRFGGPTLGSFEATVEVPYQQSGEALSAQWSVRGTVSEDADGIADAIEQAGPNGGDANLDGTPDRLQSHVASFRNDSGRYIALHTDNAPIDAVQQAQVTIDAARGALLFGDGFYQWRLPSVESASVAVRITGVDANASVYYLYDSREADAELRFAPFPFDGTSGAVFDSDGLTLYLQDGARGDADGQVNGEIQVLPGGAGAIDTRNFRITDPTVGAFDPRQGAALLLASSLYWLVRRRRRKAGEADAS